LGLLYYELHPDAYEGFDDRWPAHEMDFPGAQADEPRDDTGRVTYPIPPGYRWLTPDETILENDLFWEDSIGEFVQVPDGSNYPQFLGIVGLRDYPIIRRYFNGQIADPDTFPTDMASLKHLRQLVTDLELKLDMKPTFPDLVR